MATGHDTTAVPACEVFSLSEAPEAYQRMISGDARLRVVLGPGRHPGDFRGSSPG
ncbi:hypothetical protein [Microbispora sp. KK1-11]|uniref:hypothetical protein n=1 Tax=Microbispora sp. KK1-11 TaxID=2053005 RepID=UPI00163C5E09|nr:hypothetical protein [Microbispora sp. KK1-11]